MNIKRAFFCCNCSIDDACYCDGSNFLSDYSYVD